MPRKKAMPLQVDFKFVDFTFENRMYQIDPDHNKVYRRFVEIETSKSSQILMNWRAVAATV
jgi:hypothetical protein